MPSNTARARCLSWVSILAALARLARNRAEGRADGRHGHLLAPDDDAVVAISMRPDALIGDVERDARRRLGERA